MSPSESNSLLRALAAQPREGEHPEADLLTAFAEGALLEQEREDVMAHLAGCVECRAVLSLCAGSEQEHEPAVVPHREVIVLPLREGRSKVLTWLPWAAAAAGVAIVSGVALRYAERRPMQPSVTPESQTAEAKVPQSVPDMVPENRTRARQSNTLKGASLPSKSAKRLDAGAGSLEAPGREQKQELEDRKAAQTIAQEPSARSQEQIASSDTQPRALKAKPQSPALPPPAPAFANSITAGALMRAPAASPARAHWRINEQGHPERSFSDGAWEPVLTGVLTKMHVLSVSNGQVWVGGENDRLYRSNNDGQTWLTVPLPEKNGSAHVIVHIRFDTALTGTIEAADGTIWTTRDAGGTWR